MHCGGTIVAPRGGTDRHAVQPTRHLDLTVDGGAPGADVTTLKAIGYRIAEGFVGNLNAIAVDPQTGAARAAAR